MKFLKRVIITLIVLVIIVVAAAAIAVKTVDINQYRDQIADALSKQLGRTVKFGGPIHLAFNTHGVGVEVEDASIGNPKWASRDEMAKIGKLQLGVALMPLLNRQLEVTELDISDADISLETNASDQHNWEFKPADTSAPAVAQANKAPAEGSSASSVGIRVNELSVVNSQIAMRDKDGKTSTFKVSKMTLAPEGRSTAISLNADYNGAPIKVSLKAQTGDLMAEGKWPYDADVSYGDYHVHAQGTADISNKTFELNPYEFKAGGTSLHGQLMASMAGSKTTVHGSIMGEKLDTADLKPAGSNPPASENQNSPKETPSEPKQLFSSAPIDFSALRSTDATIDVAIDEVVVGKTSLKQANGKLVLTGGNLTLSPLKAVAAGSTMESEIKLNAASSPAQYNFSFKAPGVDMASLLEMIGTQAFISGKADTDVQLSGSGNSLHDMASTTQGHINVTSGGGQISGTAASGVASSLAQIFAPGSANPQLNCLAARFNVAEGVAKDNGMLVDSSASTVSGSGGFDLGKETVNLTLNAKPKLVNTKGLVPAVIISGSLLSPKIGINAAAEAQNVAGTLLKNNKTASAISGLLGGGGSGAAGEAAVPAMQTAPSGQNACLYTLDHKGAAPAAAATPAQQQSPTSGIKDAVGKALGGGNKSKGGIGNQLLQGIIGH